jgi:hypothetical protein
MKKLLATLVCGLLAASSQAQTQTQKPAKPQPQSRDHRTATAPPIGQAVSGSNATASGVSGTGLHTDGTADTGSAESAIGQQAAGVNSAGKVTGKSTAVINVAPERADNVNANSTNTTPPNSKTTDAPATGGRGEGNTKAVQEIAKSNTAKVKEPPGAHLKTANSAEEGAQKRKAKEKADRKDANGAAGATTEKR